MILTIDAWKTVYRFTGIWLRVLVDGEDVTKRCVSADADQGWAVLLDRRPTLDTTKVKYVLTCGEVRIVRGVSPEEREREDGPPRPSDILSYGYGWTA